MHCGTMQAHISPKSVLLYMRESSFAMIDTRTPQKLLAAEAATIETVRLYGLTTEKHSR